MSWHPAVVGMHIMLCACGGVRVQHVRCVFFKVEPSTAQPEPSDIHFPGNPCKGKLCLDMLHTRFASLFTNLTFSTIRLMKLSGDPRRDCDCLWCADCILANPIPPKSQHSKKWEKNRWTAFHCFLVLIIQGKGLCAEPMSHREYVLSERSMASDGTSRSMALGAEQDEKDLELHRNVRQLGGLMLKLFKQNHV